MNTEITGKTEVIFTGNGKPHGYFAWPSVVRLKNGNIAAACSGFRLEHICPFGKAVLALSEDDGKTFSEPEIIIDTVLDDRDAGLCTFGESGLIITSFNNTVEFQRKHGNQSAECREYLDTVDPSEEQKALGSEYRISLDNGKSWGNILHSPVTSPHGPVELKDGTVLWVGTLFTTEENNDPDINTVQAWKINPDGTMSYVGEIENIFIDGTLMNSCEPHAVELEDGTLVCHIRVEHCSPDIFTLYQSKSFDGGKTWTKPAALLSEKGGAPAHLLLHSSGTLISAYGYRKKPYGIRVMLSSDGGENWEKDKILYEQNITGDIGYPSTVELSDGSLMTVFYAHTVSDDEPASILSVKWKLTD